MEVAEQLNGEGIYCNLLTGQPLPAVLQAHGRLMVQPAGLPC